VITAAGQSRAAELSALQLLTRTEALPPPEGSTYCLEFRAADQTLLQRSCFDPGDTCGGTEESPRPFVVAVPWPASTTRVLLKFGEAVLAERSASAHRPTVRVLSPNGGETWDGERVVAWTGADDDGDGLDYTVLYTRDEGMSWTPLGMYLRAISLTVDTSQLAGGEGCRIQVRASDGFFNSEDQSDGAFTVPRKPPQAVIEAPLEGVWYRPVEYINLMGQGYDPEDGAVPDDHLTWWLTYAQGATLLGTGPMISVGPLPAGDHVINLTAEDSDGNWGGAIRTIHVGERAANIVNLPVMCRR
jgi:hypothetical protein